MKKVATIASLAMLAAAPLLADFTYQETSTITGGALMSMMKVVGVFSKQAREPIVATVSVKGDRMVHKSAQRASIIDLGTQTITSVDFQKKQYSVMTFEEMKQMLQQMQEKMKQNPDAQVNFKVSADATGKSKAVNGLDAKEMILKMEMETTDAKTGQKGSMLITTDMWLAPGVPGYQEVRDFHKRMAEKLNWTPGGNMFMQNPQIAEGMAQVAKEMSKLDGVPVEQQIVMGMAGQAGAEGAQQQQQQAQQQQQPQEKPSLGGALGGALGGRFGLGRKKSSAQQQQTDNTQAQGGGGSGQPGSLIEMTTVMSGFSNAGVGDSDFTVPAGFKKVESDMKRMR
ncbi:MAG: hypothetical protein JST11_19900 [Acidobacteria bacterium]|nr:hypothetical protein [Acidobacteriota bacterium]